jgi:hypothetical protein
MSADIKREGVSNMKKKLNLLVMLVSLLAFGFVLSGCGDSGSGDPTSPPGDPTSPPTGGGGGGGDGNEVLWRSELVPDNHATESGHKKGEWIIGDWLPGGEGTRLWMGNNNGSSYFTVDNGTEFKYGLQSVIDKPAGQESSFSIKGSSSNPDKTVYTIVYVLNTDNQSIEIKNNGGCASILTETYNLRDNGTTDGGGGNGDTGTFRIRITDIPTQIMTDGQNGLILFGLYPANTTTYTTENALAGRDTLLYGDDDAGFDWYEFSMYGLTPGSKYVGTAGNYDIAFINTSTNVGKALKNRRIEISQTNTFSYNNFVDP